MRKKREKTSERCNENEREKEREKVRRVEAAEGETANRGKLRRTFFLIPSVRAREMENVRREESEFS